MIKPLFLKTALIVVSIFLALPGRGADMFKTQTQKEAFFSVLKEQDAKYDEKERMILRPYSSPGYHSFYKGKFVHPTRDSLNYAIALLDSGDKDRLARAEDILRKVISLQDQDPKSKTYGIWSWYYEEPLSDMAPPDWNWADFCGTQLLQAAHDHMARLSPETQKLVTDSIIHAARSIKRRNVGPGYTNIALMGTYVTLMAGDMFHEKELLDYGLERLNRFWEYTQDKGSFSEYNSPTYTVVAIEEITRMCQHVKDPKAQPVLEKLNAFAWMHVARRFHPPTRQWSGPHSRCYRTLLPASQLAFIQRSTGGKVNFMNAEEAWRHLEAPRLRPSCPEECISLFNSLSSARLEVELFNKQGADPNDIIGTTYLEPEFTLGTVNIGDLWNQRRPLLAYWNADRKPVAMRIRCLHDGYDYSSASIFTVQDHATVIGAVNFATDRGDTHISLDRIKNTTIEAEDLRLRLELEGEIRDIKIIQDAANKQNFRINSGRISCEFAVAFAVFDNNEIKFETGRTNDQAYIDIIFYSGVRKKINFSSISQAGIAFGLAFSTDKAELPELTVNAEKGSLSISSAGGHSSITVPLKPMCTRDQNNSVKASLNKVNPWHQ